MVLVCFVWIFELRIGALTGVAINRMNEFPNDVLPMGVNEWIKKQKIAIRLIMCFVYLCGWLYRMWHMRGLIEI